MKKDNNIILSNNLTYYMDKNGIDRNQLCKDLDFCYSTVSEWLSAQKYPRMDKIEKLARYFGVKKSDLIENKNPPLAKNNNEITEVELQHIKKYRKLDPYGQKAVDSILDIEYKRCTEVKKASTFTFSRYSIYKASAGCGYDMDNADDWTDLEVIDTPIARQADFAVKIDGESMEPTYHDGDIVFIEATEEVRTGEIGLFIQNGKGYIKEAGKKYLISHNDEYPDVSPDDGEITCIGRVLGVAELP